VLEALLRRREAYDGIHATLFPPQPPVRAFPSFPSLHVVGSFHTPSDVDLWLAW
jgi:hypothetical protein